MKTVKYISQEKIVFMLFTILAIGFMVLVYTNNRVYKIIIIGTDFLFLCWSCFRRSGVFKIPRYQTALGIYFFWMLLSQIWAKYEGNPHIKYGTLYLLITVVLLHNMLVSKERVIALLNAVVIGAFVLAAVILVRYGITKLLSERMDNELINSNRAGSIFASVIFLCEYLFFLGKKKRYLFFIIPFAFMTLITGSKSALVTMALSTSVFFLYKDGHKTVKKYKNIILGIGAVFAVSILIFKTDAFYNIIGYRIQEFVEILIGRSTLQPGRKSNYMRITMLKYGISGILKKPVTGYGLDNFRFYSPFYGSYSHANIIEQIFNLGFVGMLLFSAPYFFIIRGMKILKSNRKERLNFAFLVSFLVYMFVFNFTGVYYNEPFEWIVTEAVCSLTAICIRPQMAGKPADMERR